jgi:flagellar basal body-associated protein FliL
MDKILWIIIAATVTVFLASSVLYISLNSTDSIVDFTDSTEDYECQQQADEWDSETEITQECIKYLEGDQQEQALAQTFESELT